MNHTEPLQAGLLFTPTLKSKTPQLLDEMFKNLPYSVAGEFIGVCIYVNLVYAEERVFISEWFFFEIFILLIQLVVHLSYNNPRFRLPINYQLAYVLTLPLSFLALSALSLFYVFGNPHLILIVGILYIALTAGGSLYHCYIKYIQLFYIFCVCTSFTLVCFLQGGIFWYIGLGSILYTSVMMFASVYLNRYLTSSFNLSENKEDQLFKLSTSKQMLNQKHQELLVEHDKQIVLERELLKLNDKLIENIAGIQKQSDIRKNLLHLIYNSVDLIIFKTNQQKEVIQYNEKFLSAFNIKNLEEVRLFPERFLSTIPISNPIHRYFPYTTANFKNYITVNTTDFKHLECTVHVLKSLNGVDNLWFIKDVTEKAEQQRKIHQMIHFDELTNLPNRVSLQQKMKIYADQAISKNKLFALAFIDLNDFKIINDSLGHGSGNEILKVYADRLQKNIRDIDFAGRLGGDEFICIFNELTYKSDVDPLVARLKDALEENIILNSNTLIVGCSIGISFYPCDTASLDELISYADIAMYRAKENNGSYYERFLPAFTAQINELHVVGQELKASLIQNAFYLEYQPIFESKTQKIAKVEVFMRWREHVPPNIFIPMAERLGIMQEMGIWVLEQACKARLELANQSHIFPDDLKFCINISPGQLQTPKQIDELLQVIDHSSCKPQWFEFELTESTLEDLDKAVTFMNTLKTRGISIAIDDFGTGFSSLSYLKNLYFDVIKIDKQFLTNIFQDPREKKIYESMINLAQMLEAKISIEGVETKEQYDFCVQAQCEYVQGFYLAKPTDLKHLQEIAQQAG